MLMLHFLFLLRYLLRRLHLTLFVIFQTGFVVLMVSCSSCFSRKRRLEEEIRQIVAGQIRVKNLLTLLQLCTTSTSYHTKVVNSWQTCLYSSSKPPHFRRSQKGVVCSNLLQEQAKASCCCNHCRTGYEAIYWILCKQTRLFFARNDFMN